MSSPSVSISRGSDNQPTEPLGGPARGWRSLQHALVAAVVPLGLLIAIGTYTVWVDARTVHRDLQRLFEEMREASLSRSLLDELRGIADWVGAETASTVPIPELVGTDLRHHLDAAAAALRRFAPPDDPSADAHTADESASLVRLRNALDGLQARLTERAPLSAWREPLQLALHHANSLAEEVTQEARTVGDDLDRRTLRLMDFLLALALVALATLLGLGLWLHHQVLRPLRSLQDGTARLAAGEPLPSLPIGRRDEIGRLAEAFAHMAAEIRAARDDLQTKVNERSREVVRTARLAELGTLAAGIAHEINNPLASIATCAEGLLRDQARGETTDLARLREYLSIIHREARRTRDITTRLLSFARQQPTSNGPVQLGAELRDVATLLEHQFRVAGVQLVLDCAPRLPTCLGNANELRQVAFNLLRNALDATPSGGVVQASVRRRDQHLELTVLDAGPGLPEADLERIFEPFYTTKPPGQGTGLGLAIAHRIVTGHGGTIQAGNAPGGGARFLVTLPIAATGADAS